MNPIKTNEWVYSQLGKEKLRLVDCRFNLKDATDGKCRYDQNHIQGAVYLDLNKDLSGEVKRTGGRHPLPNITDFIDRLEQAGITNDTVLVAYDDGEGAFAGRFWWLMKYVGHEHVYILDGGYKAWINESYPISSEKPSYKKSTYKASLNEDILATYEDVKEVVQQKKLATLVDSREAKRYLGIEEPIDRKAGHIPGAINKVWFEGFNNGYFKTAPEQQERFQELDPSEPIIVYCGSGVTATPNFIALKQAGFQQVKLYVGSFSDWISDDSNDVGKK
jgi:thiosulfate/3-mercaptopyruvate sulfurtransferase